MLCLGKMNQNPISNTVWERQLEWFKDSSQNMTLETIDREPMEFECNIFPGFSKLELVHEVREFMTKMDEPEQFQGRIIFMSMFNDIIWRNKDNEKECIANCTLVCLFEKKVSIVSSSAQKRIDNFRSPLLLSVPRDNGLVTRKIRI